MVHVNAMRSGNIADAETAHDVAVLVKKHHGIDIGVLHAGIDIGAAPLATQMLSPSGCRSTVLDDPQLRPAGIFRNPDCVI